MNDPLRLGLAWLAGIVLGTLFFGGLWWTIRKGVSAKQPALWFFGSFMLRTSVALSGLYLISGRSWERLVSCLLGFVMARLLVALLTRPASDATRRATSEARHAP